MKWMVWRLVADGANTSVLKGVNNIEELLKLVANVLVLGLGVAAVVGVVWAGILYLTARDNEQQAARAKTRLIEVAIGLVAWALMYTALQFLVPGGLHF